jgi:hypothetical protein
MPFNGKYSSSELTLAILGSTNPHAIKEIVYPSDQSLVKASSALPSDTIAQENLDVLADNSRENLSDVSSDLIFADFEELNQEDNVTATEQTRKFQYVIIQQMDTIALFAPCADRRLDLSLIGGQNILEDVLLSLVRPQTFEGNISTMIIPLSQKGTHWISLVLKNEGSNISAALYDSHGNNAGLTFFSSIIMRAEPESVYLKGLLNNDNIKEKLSNFLGLANPTPSISVTAHYLNVQPLINQIDCGPFQVRVIRQLIKGEEIQLSKIRPIDRLYDDICYYNTLDLYHENNPQKPPLIFFYDIFEDDKKFREQWQEKYLYIQADILTFIDQLLSLNIFSKLDIDTIQNQVYTIDNKLEKLCNVLLENKSNHEDYNMAFRIYRSLCRLNGIYELFVLNYPDDNTASSSLPQISKMP